jgi:hypothetical protein
LIPTDARPAAPSGLAVSAIRDELVVLVPGAEHAISLNPSARAIFEQCDGSRTVGEICGTLGTMYECPTAELETDVRAAVGQLVALGVLTVR